MMKQAGLLALLMVVAIADASEPPSTTQQQQMRSAMTRAQAQLEEERSQESAFADLDRDASEPGSTSSQHNRFTFSLPANVEKGNRHRINVLQAKQLAQVASPAAVLPMLRNTFVSASQFDAGHTCDMSAKYRTANGSCNNLQNTRWGMASIPMRRWLKPAYDDGISSPRERASDRYSKLPSARLVSRTVHTPSRNADLNSKFSHMLMQWGQFLDHDFASTPIQQPSAGPRGSFGCCSPIRRGKRRASEPSPDPSNRPQCFPIVIPQPDRHFTSNCMNFVRSVQIENAERESVPVEQMNQITSFIDASNVYGSSQEEQDNLRTFENGELKMRRSHLPEDPLRSCNTPNAPSYCFLAGDHRVNENPTLQSMHTIFVREHNRIAKKLQEMNCDWSDEKTFQEARKIVGAIMQKITYDEYLPIILGNEAMTKYGLRSKSGKAYADVYSASIDPSIRNAFATAAFRMGHTMIHSNFSSFSSSHNFLGRDRLSEIFGDTNLILNVQNRQVGHYCRGLVKDSVQNTDHKLALEVSDLLFADSKGNSLDLGALNIQRGRDHGLPSYTEWRKFCNVAKVASFYELASTTHTKDVAKLLEEAYDHVDDIDLFPGALSETPVPGGLLGPTFTCLLGKQFQALKIGDRFWFEENNAHVKFTQKQLKEIRKASLSKVVCDNTDTYEIQQNAFIKGYPVSCHSLPEVNLSKWKAACTWGIWTPWGKCIHGFQSRSRIGKNCDCTSRLKCSSESSESEESEMKKGSSEESGSNESGSKKCKPKESGSKGSGSDESGSRESKSRESGWKGSGSDESGSRESKSRESGWKGSGSDESGSRESKSRESGWKGSGSKKSGSSESKSRESGSKGSGSDESGSSESKSRESGSHESGSSESKSRESGSKGSGSHESGSSESKSRESGSKGSGSDESGSSESKSRESGSKGSGSDESGSRESKSRESGSKKTEWRKCKSNESGSKESESRESKSSESGSKESESRESKSNESGSKESQSRESKSNESGSKESESRERRSKDSDSEERESEEGSYKWKER